MQRVQAAAMIRDAQADGYRGGVPPPPVGQGARLRLNYRWLCIDGHGDRRAAPPVRERVLPLDLKDDAAVGKRGGREVGLRGAGGKKRHR